jgi:hypothetical protein
VAEQGRQQHAVDDGDASHQLTLRRLVARSSSALILTTKGQRKRQTEPRSQGVKALKESVELRDRLTSPTQDAVAKN